MHCPVVGAVAPDFELEATDPAGTRTTVRRDDYLGKWLVILFYPRDFSFVCPTELTSFSAERIQFATRGCELLGISIDDSQTHADWMSTPEHDGGVEGLQFPLASDPDGEVCRRYGVWRDVDALPNRGMFLIDPEGVLRYAVTYDLAVGRNVDSAIQSIDALQAGGLCPANWKRADGVLDVEALLLPNRVLGHYRIQREIGRGAFGRVLAAQDLRLKREVALKIIDSAIRGSGVPLLEEARAAAAINHPNVCTIHAVETIDTIPTIVMEHIEGTSLRELIGDGFDETSFRRIAAGLAAGLSAAHQGNVVHGDIKPANVLLREKQDPVLVDFGLATLIGRKRSERTEPAEVLGSAEQSFRETIVTKERPQHTAEIVDMDETVDLRGLEGDSTQKISGTPAYMAPEQFQGQAASKASDVFSLGLILCEMSAGQMPTLTMPLLEIYRSLRDRAFLRSMASQVPADFVDLVCAMLEPEREKRITSTEAASILSA